MSNLSFRFVGGIDAIDVNRMVKKAETATVKSLKRAGAFLRTSAIRSLRRRKKAAPAGSPPSVHSKHPYATLKNIRFAVENSSTVVVGPLLFKKPSSQDRLATNIQEFGGSVVRYRPAKATTRTARKPASVSQKQHFRRKILNGSITVVKREKVQQTIHVAARPFMAPTLVREMPKIPPIWERSISQ